MSEKTTMRATEYSTSGAEIRFGDRVRRVVEWVAPIKTVEEILPDKPAAPYRSGTRLPRYEPVDRAGLSKIGPPVRVRLSS